MTDSEPADGAESRSDATADRGRRDVVVPMRLYKTITVFSTLIAAICIVSGFILVDAATLQASALRGGISFALGAVGLSVANDVLSAALAIAGLCAMAFGAGVFILSSRFRAAGMGNSQEDSDEESDNG